jgi:hypothetical protein
LTKCRLGRNLRASGVEMTQPFLVGKGHEYRCHEGDSVIADAWSESSRLLAEVRRVKVPKLI